MTVRATASDLSARLERAAYWLALAVVVTLPYSVSATSVLVPVWIAVLVPTLSRRDLLDELKAPRSFLPVALALIMILGLLWGEGTERERFAAAGALAKLLVLPLFFLQFRRSGDGGLLARAFVVALVPILALSFATLIWPNGLVNTSQRPDVPFKDYIAQSGLFAFAVYLLAHAALDAWRAGDRVKAVLAALLAIAFLANIVFIVTARTTLVIVPLLALIFIAQRVGARAGVALVLVGAALGGIAWSSSPQLRGRALAVATELGDWQRSGAVTSSGLRVEWWGRSLGFIAQSPLIGHGTGSIPSLFRRVASGEFVAAQPHNQVLTVGLQVGVAGILLLLAMWAVHGILFLRGTGAFSEEVDADSSKENATSQGSGAVSRSREIGSRSGAAAMIGFAVVAQNVVSSLFNSHLTDFTQGWAYVLGVGICGGLTLATRDRSA